MSVNKGYKNNKLKMEIVITGKTVITPLLGISMDEKIPNTDRKISIGRK